MLYCNAKIFTPDGYIRGGFRVKTGLKTITDMKKGFRDTAPLRAISPKSFVFRPDGKEKVSLASLFRRSGRVTLSLRRDGGLRNFFGITERHLCRCGLHLRIGIEAA